MLTLNPKTTAGIISDSQAEEARVYAQHHEWIRNLKDDELIRLARSDFYQHQPRLRQYVNTEVVRRGLAVIQFDRDTLVTPGSEGAASRDGLSHEDVGDILARFVVTLVLLFVGAITMVALRKMLILLAVGDLLYHFLNRGFKTSLRVTVHYICIRGVMVWRQRRTIDALQSMADRPLERPVVYLRSFMDDPKSATVIGRSTEEEQIAITFNHIGPFVALGRPNETLPYLGAARIYVRNEKWHEVVEKLISEAQIVIMRIGRTDGFWWELDRAVHGIPPERLFLLVPCDKDLYRNFCIKAESLLPRKLPEYISGLRDTGMVGRGKHWLFFKLFPQVGSMGSLRGLLYFEPDWTPHFVKFETTLRGTLKAPGAAALIIAAQPALKTLGVNLPVPGFSWLRVSSLTGIVILSFGELFLFVRLVDRLVLLAGKLFT